MHMHRAPLLNLGIQVDSQENHLLESKHMKKHHLSVFQGLLVQLMHVLLFPSVSDVESLDGDIEVVLHVARIRDHSLEEKSS